MRDWYGIDVLPDGRLRVRGIWYVHGLPEVMDLARERVGGKLTWFRIEMRPGQAIGDVRAIPPRGRDGAYWEPGPYCWQPRDDAWTWPGKEPEPLQPHMVPRLVGDRYVSRAAAEAEAAELAAEVRADQAVARLNGRSSDRDEAGIDRWWRDPSRIVYEPAGQVSLRMCEGRVLRAMAHAGPAFDRYRLRTLTTAALLARLAESREILERELDRVARGMLDRFEPTQGDHTDFDEAMRWVAALNPESIALDNGRPSIWQHVVMYCASDLPLSWETIGLHLGMPADRAMGIYRAAIEACHRVANGAAAFDWSPDSMAALRERNRAYRRRS